jgi:hypothetical protein
LNKTLEGVKTTYVQALAQLILLKWPKYWEPSTDSMHYTSKFQWNSSHK